MAHQEISAGNSNELLRLAQSTCNGVAAEMLLTIDAVRSLAAAHDFYRTESHQGIDIRQLARDRESSMTALTAGESRRLDAAMRRYQPMIQQAGIAHIMTALRDQLSSRYAQHPAQVSIKGQQVCLPLDYPAFQALHLQGDDYETALKAYYQHPDHTAWRYLSQPNPWMHPQASYVYVNESRTERWSTFTEYQPLIAMYYLAALDKEMPATDGHTLESRLDHFIKELALIGRAHNWDKMRTREGKEEEYDDCEGDRPSCFSGVKRRLFQSVLGHPLLHVLTLDDIKMELRDVVRDHFMTQIATNRERFKKALDEYISNAGPNEHTAPLKELDLTEAQQQQFIAALEHKYGASFAEDIPFKTYIRNAFNLDAAPKDYAHAIRFAGEVQLAQLLNPPSASKAETSAPAATHEDSAASQTHSTAADSQRSLWLTTIGFQAQLNVLEAKTKQMATQGVNYANAYQTAHKLITQLKKAEEDFTHGQNVVQQDKKAFKSACLAAIRQASPELQKHRGWKDILSKVASVFLSVLSFGVANLLTGYSLCGLFPTKTDAAEKLEALSNVIHNADSQSAYHV